MAAPLSVSRAKVLADGIEYDNASVFHDHRSGTARLRRRGEAAPAVVKAGVERVERRGHRFRTIHFADGTQWEITVLGGGCGCGR